MIATHDHELAVSDLSVRYANNRQHEYEYTLPTVPRILVPPPAMSTPTPALHVGAAVDREEDDTSFLKEVNLADVIKTNTMLEWTYDRRREAQMILPWLFLGPYSAARDREYLLRESITMTLAVRGMENSMSGAMKVGGEVCQEVAAIDASSHYTLIREFPRATRMINQHVGKIRRLAANGVNPRMGRVLVYCESGNENSAAVVAAYLMETLDSLNHITAMQVCLAQRFCTNFDDGLKNMLSAYFDILQAKRAVSRARTESLQPVPPAAGVQTASEYNAFHHAHVPTLKRSIQETIEDEDIDMDGGVDADDGLRFNGRANTPYRDL
jgi:hypothetical protein